MNLFRSIIMFVSHSGARIFSFFQGPFFEEVVFRALNCTLLLAGGWSVSAIIFGSPLLFGIGMHASLSHVSIVSNDDFHLSLASVLET